MKGICITTKGSIDFSFEYIFRPVMPRFASHYWISYNCEPSPFYGVIYDNEETYKNFFHSYDEKRDIAIFRPKVLPAYKYFLKSDWLTLVGVRMLTDQALEFFEYLKKGKNYNKEYEYIDSISDLCLFNNDGGSWEYYTDNEDDIYILKKRYKNETSLVVQAVELKNRDQLF